MGKFIDLAGRTFGRLEVLHRLEERIGKEIAYSCKCSCGTVCVKSAGSLRSGTKSCGCLHSENARHALEFARESHITHGMTKTKTYVCWKNMKARCDDPNHPAYINYGARGITYDPFWKTFESFYEDMGDCPDGLTLNRIDVNSNYGKSNCEWADRTQQGFDRRKPRTGKTSEYKGVSWSNAEGKYKGAICHKGDYYHLGYSSDPLLLALRYDIKLLELTGSGSGSNRELGLLPQQTDRTV